jgi:DNA-binding cell septation regulator SpoVG
MAGQYIIVRDSFNRLRAEITESFAIGVKLLAEDHPRRVEQHVHAYVVADLRTELGPWRIRDIRVMWSPENERYFVRYRQWKTGKIRDGREEWLDVAGPLDRETRAKVQDAILGVFSQIKEEAAKGVLGKRVEGTHTALGDNPILAAQLESIKKDLEGDIEADAAEIQA